MSNPERAINNLLARDMLLSKRVVEQAELRSLRVEVVEGTRPIEAMVDLVEQHFKLYLQADTLSEEFR